MNKVTCPECGREFSKHLVTFPVFSDDKDKTMVYYVCPICADESKGKDKPFDFVHSQKLLEEALIEAKKYGDNYQKQPVKKKDRKLEKLTRLTGIEKDIVNDHLSEVHTIKSIWEHFKMRPYPDNAHIENLELEKLDTFMAGCISSYLSNSGELDTNKIQILQKCIIDLNKDIVKIPDTARKRFDLLSILSSIVLKAAMKMYLYKFKGFSPTWIDKSNLFIDKNGGYTLHGLFSQFSNYFRQNINDISDDQLKDFFSNIEIWIVNDIYNDDELANAVCTCFLELIAREEFAQRIKPFMGKKSLEYYSHYDY